MTHHRSGTTQGRPAPPRAQGDLPYTALRNRPIRQKSAAWGRFYRIAHLLAIVLGPVVLLSLAAAGVVYVRLIHGPVSLKVFRDSIAQSINADLEGFQAAIDDAVIRLADDYTVELRLINLRLSEPDGDLVASAPEAAVELNKAALLTLEARPERVDLIEPKLTIAYSEAQGFSLSIAEIPPVDPATGEAPIVPPRPVPATPPAAKPDGGSAPAFHRIDVARILSEASARARRDRGSTSRIRAFGVRKATVAIAYEGHTSELKVAEASVDLEHMKRRSVISGTATIESERGPWSLTFRTDESPRQNELKVVTTVRDFVPSTLSRIAPDLALLATLDTPMTGELGLDLSSEGDLKSANLAVDLGRGFISLPSLSSAPVLLDAGRLGVAYDAAQRRIALSPITLDLGGSRMTLDGVVSGAADQGAGEPQWNFKVQAIEGVLSAEEFGAPAVPIESLEAAGRIIPGEGLVQLAQFSLKAGGGEVTANGEVITGSGTPSTRVEAHLSPMPITTLKAMWPRAAAPAARSWIGTQVERGNIESASLKVLSGQFLQGDGADGQAAQSAHDRVSASIEVSDLRMHPLPKSLPMEAAQATLRLENSTLELTVPQAAIMASETSQLPLKDVRFTVIDVMQDAPMAELAIKSQANLSALIDTLNHSQLHLTGEGPLPVEGVEGKVDGEIRIAMPLVAGGSVVKAEGKARITELKGKSKLHKLDLQGGSVDISVSDVGVIAKGDMILNGVPAKLQMQRILDAPPEMQPPIRILTTLDNSDRTQLGLDVNHLVQGSVPIEVVVTQKAEGPAAIHVRADLTNAELLFVDIAWRKSPGRIASLEFDVDATDPTRIGLNNFRLVGDTIAIDGSLTVSEKREVTSFSFPNLSLNVVSRLKVEGTIGDDRIWKIKATGTTFDAKDLFRSLLALGNTSDAEIKPLHPAKGVDLTANIDTVLGHGDISLRKYKAKISERGEKLVSVDASGTFDGGAPLSVVLKDDSRVLHADSSDAGQALRLIGFYPNMQGGRLRLDVNLEAKGAAEKSGELWVEDFRVLGDPIVSEVYSGGEANPEGGKPKKVLREVLEFQRMRAPFEIGHGQFVLDDSYLRGPLLGASIRGTVDYNTRRIALGGTYVPLQGINAAICDFPVLGPVVAGFDCQGVFGITYSIEGPMASPQVYVNPLSMFTPGILRAIMEMTNPNPQVKPVNDRGRPAEGSARSSGTSVSDGSGIDGWSSEATPASKKQGAKKP